MDGPIVEPPGEAGLGSWSALQGRVQVKFTAWAPLEPVVTMLERRARFAKASDFL